MSFITGLKSKSQSLPFPLDGGLAKWSQTWI